MTKIYHKVFAVSELDRERDESLTMRMSALGFIEPKHLDIPQLYHDEKAWILARKELHKINNYKVCSLIQTLQACSVKERHEGLLLNCLAASVLGTILLPMRLPRLCKPSFATLRTWR